MQHKRQKEKVQTANWRNFTPLKLAANGQAGRRTLPHKHKIASTTAKPSKAIQQQRGIPRIRKPIAIRGYAAKQDKKQQYRRTGLF